MNIESMISIKKVAADNSRLLTIWQANYSFNKNIAL